MHRAEPTRFVAIMGATTATFAKVVVTCQETPLECAYTILGLLYVGAARVAIGCHQCDLTVPIRLDDTPLHLQRLDAGIGIGGADGIA
jgi:hypothetical protein